jgi:hypothetical protein
LDQLGSMEGELGFPSISFAPELRKMHWEGGLVWIGRGLGGSNAQGVVLEGAIERAGSVDEAEMNGATEEEGGGSNGVTLLDVRERRRGLSWSFGGRNRSRTAR